MKKLKLLRALLTPLFVITAFSTFVSTIASCGNGQQSEEDKTSNVTLNKSSIILDINSSEKLIAHISSLIDVQSTAWSCLDNSIATVDQQGNIMAVATGKTYTKILVTSKQGDEYQATCEVIVAGIVLDKSYLELSTGVSKKITAAVYPENTKVTWSTTAPTIAVVDQNGNVKANGAGIATIKIASDGGKYQATCEVSITDKIIHVNNIVLDKINLNLGIFNTGKIRATTIPENATNTKIMWISQDTNIATVDSNGNVTPNEIGSTIIVAQSIDGLHQATCNVKITNNGSIDNFIVLDAQENQSLLNYYKDAAGACMPDLQYAKYISNDQKLDWKILSKDEYIFLSKGEKYLLRGNNPNGWDVYNDFFKKWDQNGNILIKGNVKLSGSINALIDNGAGNKDFSLPSRCFSSLFINSTGITSVDANFLPSTNLGPMCYNGLFRGCTSLIEAPDLPAKNLQPACYAYIFRNCEKLNKIKIMYDGYADDAPENAFLEWAIGVNTKGGKFYYNGRGTTGSFYLPQTWDKIYFGG